jgi:hypothetical protein
MGSSVIPKNTQLSRDSDQFYLVHVGVYITHVANVNLLFSAEINAFTHLSRAVQQGKTCNQIIDNAFSLNHAPSSSSILENS